MSLSLLDAVQHVGDVLIDLRRSEEHSEREASSVRMLSTSSRMLNWFASLILCHMSHKLMQVAPGRNQVVEGVTQKLGHLQTRLASMSLEPLDLGTSSWRSHCSTRRRSSEVPENQLLKALFKAKDVEIVRLHLRHLCKEVVEQGEES